MRSMLFVLTLLFTPSLAGATTKTVHRAGVRFEVGKVVQFKYSNGSQELHVPVRCVPQQGKGRALCTGVVFNRSSSGVAWQEVKPFVSTDPFSVHQIRDRWNTVNAVEAKATSMLAISALLKASPWVSKRAPATGIAGAIEVGYALNPFAAATASLFYSWMRGATP